MVMIDFVTASIPCNLPFPITDGCIVDMDESGGVRWQSHKRLAVEGSYSGKMTFRSIDGRTLEISGNPAKFLQGHNLYGSGDLQKVISRVLQRALPAIFWEMPDVSVSRATVSRVDVTDGYTLERPDDVTAYIRAMHESAAIAYKGRGVLEHSTLVFGRAGKGQRAKDWQLVMYAKGLEILKRPLPTLMMNDPEVREWVARLLRVEVRLRSRELAKLGPGRESDWTDGCNREDAEEAGLRAVRNWGAETAQEVWAGKVGLVEMTEVREVPTAELEHLKTRVRLAYAAWRHGEDLGKGMSRASFYRLRRQMKEDLGVDIALPVPRSNVVPLVRVLEARPAMRPSWADRIDIALAG